jgi:hypothetical protein
MPAPIVAPAPAFEEYDFKGLRGTLEDIQGDVSDVIRAAEAAYERLGITLKTVKTLISLNQPGN